MSDDSESESVPRAMWSPAISCRTDHDPVPHATASPSPSARCNPAVLEVQREIHSGTAGAAANGEWRLLWIRSNHAVGAAPVTMSAGELHRRERAAGISGQYPVWLDPFSRIDARLSDFVWRSRFGTLSPGTAESYAHDYRLFFTFLTQRGKNWCEAAEEDFRDWHNWRRLDKTNPRRIGGAKWNRELAALRLLYEWAHRKRHVVEAPAILRDLRARDARASNVKWLTRRAFSKWRYVGLLGYSGGGLRSPQFRGRQGERNAAFADLMFGSGLRLREGGSLLVAELPGAHGETKRYYPFPVASATAKGGARTGYIPIDVVQAVSTYCDTTRALAVLEAQRAGRYDAIHDRLVVHSESEAAVLHCRDTDGRMHKLPQDLIDSETRRRLFTSTANGLAPLALWLDELGMPMHYNAWKKIFRTASVRCQKEGLQIRCTPHMLRHSFALHMLISLQYAFDRRLGLTAEERRYYQDVYGNVWTLVRDLLGHRSEDTTKDIYLEPVRGLQLEEILRISDRDEDRDVDEIMKRVARETGLVLDVR